MSAKKNTAPARSLDTFGVTHVKAVKLPQQIRAALAEMLKLGAEWYEAESELQKRIRCAPKDLARVRDQFAAHIVVVKRENADGKKHIWFASAKIAAKARAKQKADDQFNDTPQP
jgi:hypothetical protein